MSNNERKTGLRKKIILSIFFIAIIPGLAGLLITYWQGKKGLRESIGSGFQEIARETAKKVDIVLENEVDEAKHLSISYEIKDALSRANHGYKGKKQETIKKEMREINRGWDNTSSVSPFVLKIVENSASSFLKRFNYFEPEGHIELAVYDKEGGLVASIKKTDKYYIGNESWWSVVSRSNRVKAYLSDVSYHDKTETYTFDIVYPIVDEKAGGFMGVVRMVHDVSMFFNEVTNIKIGKTGHANLISSAGTILVCPIYPVKSHNITESLIVEILKRRLGWTIAEDDAHGGKNSVVGFAPVNFVEKYSSDGVNFGGKKWYIFVRQAPSETFAPINRLMWQVSIIALSLAIVLGALGFYASNRIMKPIHILHTGAEIIGNGDLSHRVSVNTGDEIEQLAHEFNLMAEKLKTRQEELENAYLGTIKAITSAIDAKDKYTRGHSKRVTDLSLAMGKQLGFTAERLSVLECASLFHDVGKIGIEDAILNKASKLTEAEYSIIKKHPQIGVDIIKDVDYLRPIIPIIRHDHERYNGSGYPDGLVGESIPVEARVISVADFYDAITTNRPYRKGLDHEDAVREIIARSGTEFDPKIVDTFLECIEDFTKKNNGDDNL
ncbi:MAG: HD domain-containing phosphohydrolase [Nitrospirota bacterium]